MLDNIENEKVVFSSQFPEDSRERLISALAAATTLKWSRDVDGVMTAQVQQSGSQQEAAVVDLIAETPLGPLPPSFAPQTRFGAFLEAAGATPRTVEKAQPRSLVWTVRELERLLDVRQEQEAASVAAAVKKGLTGAAAAAAAAAAVGPFPVFAACAIGDYVGAARKAEHAAALAVSVHALRRTAAIAGPAKLLAGEVPDEAVSFHLLVRDLLRPHIDSQTGTVSLHAAASVLARAFGGDVALAGAARRLLTAATPGSEAAVQALARQMSARRGAAGGSALSRAETTALYSPLFDPHTTINAAIAIYLRMDALESEEGAEEAAGAPSARLCLSLQELLEKAFLRAAVTRRLALASSSLLSEAVSDDRVERLATEMELRLARAAAHEYLIGQKFAGKMTPNASTEFVENAKVRFGNLELNTISRPATQPATASAPLAMREPSAATPCHSSRRSDTPPTRAEVPNDAALAAGLLQDIRLAATELVTVYIDQQLQRAGAGRLLTAVVAGQLRQELLQEAGTALIGGLRQLLPRVRAAVSVLMGPEGASMRPRIVNRMSQDLVSEVESQLSMTRVMLVVRRAAAKTKGETQ